MTPVKSSNIAAVDYNPGTKVLTIQFKGKGDAPGNIYDYADFPAELYQRFVNAESVGSFFHEHIRNSFKGVKREEKKS